jgi:hypothetical protein
MFEILQIIYYLLADLSFFLIRSAAVPPTNVPMTVKGSGTAVVVARLTVPNLKLSNRVVPAKLLPSPKPLNEIEEIGVSEVKPAKLRLGELRVFKLNVSPVESVMVKGTMSCENKLPNSPPTAVIPEGRVAIISQPEQLRIVVPEPKSPGKLPSAITPKGVPNPDKAVKVICLPFYVSQNSFAANKHS